MDRDAGSVKRCPACGENKPGTPDYFYRDRGRPDGLTPRCKACFHDLTFGNLKVTNVVDGMRQCSRCGEWKPLDREHFTVNKGHSTGFYSACKECRSAKRKATYDPAPRKAWARMRMDADPDWQFKQTRKALVTRYGITLEDYGALLEKQGGVCAICKEPETAEFPDGRVKMLAIDHDHSTGAVRGLLCTNCNVGLARFKDDAKRCLGAADYLENPPFQQGDE